METETLSIDSAVDALMNMPEFAGDEPQDSGADTATHEENHSGQDDPDLDLDLADADESPSGDEVDDDSGEADEGPSLTPPEFWDSEDKAAFSQLSREAQQTMLKHDERRTRATDIKLKEAAEARNRADQEAKRFQETYSQLQQIIPAAQQKFVSQWANVDWQAAYQQNPQQTAAARIEYERDLADLNALQATTKKAEAQALNAYVQSEGQKLVEFAVKDSTAAKLLDPTHGAKARGDVLDFLVQRGIPKEQALKAGALEMMLAHDAMMYRRAVDRQASKKPQAKPVQSSGMRSPTSPAKSTQGSKIEAQSRRLSQTGKADDLVALLTMQSQQRPKKRP